MGQNVLIPYKKGNQYGLCDKRGKVVLQPKFDNLGWLTDEYFETERKIALNDTLETSPNHYFLRKNDTVKVSGLIYKGKEIVVDQPYRNYSIYVNNCIIAKCETRYNHLTKEQYIAFKQRDKFISLLNIYGKNVYPDNFKRLEVADTPHIDNKNQKTKKFLLFKSEDFRYRVSLFLFDVEKQSIAEWLLKDAQKLSIRKMDIHNKTISVDYTDSNSYSYAATIDYGTNKFVVTQQEVPIIKKYGNMGSGSGNIREEIRRDGYMDDVAVPVEEGRDMIYEKPAFRPYYKRVKDSLFYVTDVDKKNCLNTNREKFYFLQMDGMEQYEQPVIYQRDNKYGLIIKGNFETNIYDSLFYLGTNYLAYLKDNNKLKCGVLFANGSIDVPFIYDSIEGQMKEYSLQFAYRGSAIELREKKTYDYYGAKTKKNLYVRKSSDKLVVYKDGKCGVLNMKNEILIPAKYDLIADNGLGNMHPRSSNYIILKNGDKYGITNLNWSKEAKKLEMSNTIEPIFANLPTYFYKDYYNIKDFKLFALYNNAYDFVGYASETGFIYAENN
jgi:hypothetical protein